MSGTTIVSRCINVAARHVLMVKLPGETAQIVKLHSPDGLTLKCWWVNSYSGDLIRETGLRLDGDVTLFLVASEQPDWYYIVKFSAYHQRYGCSCFPGKEFQHTHEPCPHMPLVEQFIAEGMVA